MTETERASTPGPRTGLLSQDAIRGRLGERFGSRILASRQYRGQTSVVVDRADLIEVLTFLRDDPALGFDLLADVTVVDHLYLELEGIPERFVVIYQMTSLGHGHSFRLKVPVPEDDPSVPSAGAVWQAALWGEREAHDMYGIRFDGNPDLRRLLMPADYRGFPLRKDYPLRGKGERDRFPKLRAGEAVPVEVDGVESGDGGARSVDGGGDVSVSRR